MAFARLHEKRFDAIQTIYEKLATVSGLVQSRAVETFQGNYGSVEHLHESIADFRKVYTERVVLIPLPLERQLKVLHASMSSISRRLEDADHPAWKEEEMQAWINDVVSLSTQINEGVSAIKRQMRLLLGDADDPQRLTDQVE